jgi:hypothetical protein
LLLVYRRNPTDKEVQANDHTAHYPHDLAIVGAVVAENDSEDDAAKVASSTDDTRDDAVLNMLLANMSMII